MRSATKSARRSHAVLPQQATQLALAVLMAVCVTAAPAFAQWKPTHDVEFVVPFQMWREVAVPKDIRADAMKYWEGIMRKVTASKAFREYIATNMATEHVLVGADFQKFLERQENLYRDMLKRLQEGK